MGLKIRLARAGAKKRPYYHIVIADSRSPRDGRFIERVGSYNPMLPAEHEDRLRLQTERLTHWLQNGAVATERVAKFLGKAGNNGLGWLLAGGALAAADSFLSHTAISLGTTHWAEEVDD